MPERFNPVLSTSADAATRESPALAPADAPWGFALGEVLGRGGMGVVCRARDLSLGRDVAVKLVRDPNASAVAVARFTEEARITGGLQHPGVPAVYQAGTTPSGRPFLAMKLIEGRTLEALLAAGSPVSALGVFESVCQAVGYAHSKGVIHRDLKPANVMVGAFGEVQVLDWGLAKVLGGAELPAESGGLSGESELPRTHAGSVLGTPAYIPPEQAAGDAGKVSERSDVFGLGAVLCALLTGRPPHDGTDSLSTLLAAVRGDTAAAFARLDASGADPDVVALCKNCLALDPADRPADGGAVAAAVAALRSAADERAKSAELDAAQATLRAAESAKRRRVVQWAATAVVLVLSVAVAGVSLALLDALRARSESEMAAKLEQAARVKAETAEVAQARERQGAEAEAARARLVSEFMGDLLASSDPIDLFGKSYVPGNTRELSNRTARQLLDEAAAQIPDKLAAQPRVRAKLMTTIGSSYVNLGEFTKARELLSAAQTTRAGLLPPGHPEVVAGDKALAQLLLESGDLAAAEAAFRGLVAGARSRGDERELTQARGFLAWALAMQGRPEAEAALREEVADRTRLYGPQHRETLFMQVGLMSVLLDFGKVKEGAELLPAILRSVQAQPEGQVRSLGAAAGDFQLGVVAMMSAQKAGPLGDLLMRNSEDILRGALARAERALPAKSIYLAMFHWQLGFVRHLRGDAVGAGREFAAALEVVRATCGLAHPKSLKLVEAFGEVYRAAGTPAKARALYAEAAAARVARFGPGDPVRPTLLAQWSAFEGDAGDDARALELAREAVAVANRVRPAPNLYLALAFSEAAAGLPGSAARVEVDLLEAALPSVRACYPGVNRHAVAVESRLGRARFRAGDRAAGEAEVRAAAAVADGPRLRGDAECRAQTRLLRGEVEAELGHWAAAEADAKEALASAGGMPGFSRGAKALLKRAKARK